MDAGGSTSTTMSDTHASTAHDTHADAGNGGGHADGHGEHGHDADTLGPIDTKMWGVGVLGVVAAVVIVACFVVATKFSFVA
jgi:hypothetical protein